MQDFYLYLVRFVTMIMFIKIKIKALHRLQIFNLRVKCFHMGYFASVAAGYTVTKWLETGYGCVRDGFQEWGVRFSSGKWGQKNKRTGQKTKKLEKKNQLYMNIIREMTRKGGCWATAGFFFSRRKRERSRTLKKIKSLIFELLFKIFTPSPVSTRQSCSAATHTPSR